MQHDRITVDAHIVAHRIEALRRAFPELNEDADVLASAVEGETDFERVMERILDAFLDTVSMKGALADRMSDMKSRADRLDNKADALKGLAKELMTVAGQSSVRLPVATISIRKGPRPVHIENVDDLPQGFKRVEVVPLKVEIAKSLKAGEDVPGARLLPAAEHLSVSTK